MRRCLNSPLLLAPPFPERFAERLTGKTITALGRRAKYLTMHVQDGPVLICHLGMSGSFRIETEDDNETPGVFHHERSKSTTHDHVVFDVAAADGARSRVIFNDPRRFGFMLFAEGSPETHPMLAGLGVEPTPRIRTTPGVVNSGRSRLFRSRRQIR